MTEGLSVVICCYNSAERLPQTLRHLAIQKYSPGLNWEVIIVDNNSLDATADVARKEWAQYSTRVPLKVVTERDPGLSAARSKGVSSASFEFIVFCDDD